MSTAAVTSHGEVLAVDGVGVALGGRQVLDGVSFTVGAGQFTGLIGSNGAGKTTLLRVILGLQRPGSGSVRLAARSSRRGGGTCVGYVPQKVVLDPDLPLRARDLVELGIDGHRFGPRWRTGGRRQAVDEVLAAVGAERVADARVGRLSGGETQRVLIAQALVSGPRLLLLDEPLANLDLRSTHEIVSLLYRICAERDVAVFLSAHDVNQILPVMDSVVYLASGRAASGPTEAVIRSDVLSDLYGHRVDVLHVGRRLLVVTGEAVDDMPADHGSGGVGRSPESIPGANRCAR